MLRRHLGAALVSRNQCVQSRWSSTVNSSSITLNLRQKLACLTVGSVSGAVGTIIGLGGGAIAVPMVKFFTPLSQQQASATILPVVLCSASLGAFSYVTFGSPDCVDWAGAALLGITASLCTPLGIRAAHVLPSHLVSRVMGLFMLAVIPLATWEKIVEVVGRFTVVEEERSTEGVDPPIEAEEDAADIATTWHIEEDHSFVPPKHHEKETLVSTPERIAFTSVLGCFVGFVGGAFGIGGGIVLVPTLNLLTDSKSATATSLASILVPSLVGTASVWRKKLIVWPAMWPILIGGACCSVLGAKLSCYLNDNERKACFSATMLTLGTRLLVVAK